MSLSVLDKKTYELFATLEMEVHDDFTDIPSNHNISFRKLKKESNSILNEETGKQQRKRLERKKVLPYLCKQAAVLQAKVT